MSKAILEHVNLTVSDPDKTADMMVKLFGWKVRWSGAALGNGRTVHVGNDADYVVLYSVGDPKVLGESENYGIAGAVNHLGILVDDLDAAEQKVLAFGIKTHSHQTYEPGSRFYFHDHDNIEYEVVSYA